ncbi:MAG TPA: hypothetical protein VFI70_00330 [Nitrososphaeraceae archaeon]|nr:hypothetical protein [Nitrososphaeraceae archaeon]
MNHKQDAILDKKIMLKELGKKKHTVKTQYMVNSESTILPTALGMP